MIQRQDCREISGSQVGMTHHTETVVRADVKGWLRDPGPSCLSRGEGQTQQKRVTHRDKRSSVDTAHQRVLSSSMWYLLKILLWVALKYSTWDWER